MSSGILRENQPFSAAAAALQHNDRLIVKAVLLALEAADIGVNCGWP
jgi:hypothetical protein